MAALTGEATTDVASGSTPAVQAASMNGSYDLESEPDHKIWAIFPLADVPEPASTVAQRPKAAKASCPGSCLAILFFGSA